MSDDSPKTDGLIATDRPVLDLFSNYMKLQNCTPNKREYTVGDDCWFHADDFDDNGRPLLTHGTVVGAIAMEGNPDIQYLIRPSAQYYTHFEVRDWRLMTADKSVNPAVWPPVLRARKPRTVGVT